MSDIQVCFSPFFSGWLPACFTHLCQPLLPFGENYSPHIPGWNIAQYDTVSNPFQHIHSIKFLFLSHFQLLLVCPPHSQGNSAAVKLQLRLKHDLTDFMNLQGQNVRICMFYGVQLAYLFDYIQRLHKIYTFASMLCIS